MFNAGILGGGIVFSPEQLMLDMDMLHGLSRFCEGLGDCGEQGNCGDSTNHGDRPDRGGHNDHIDRFDRYDESLKLIRERGIGGLFIDTEHTISHFRECLRVPSLLERFRGTETEAALKYDPVQRAYEQWQAILKNTPMYTIDHKREAAIDEVVRSAEKELLA